MALIKREALLSAAIDVEVNGVTISAVPAGIIRYAPTIDPIRAAGGCRCGESHHSSYDAEYNKRWCNRDLGCREVKADGSGFCDLGVPREGQDDG